MATNLSAPVIRRLGPEDAEAILDVALLCDIAEMGEPDTDLDDVVNHVLASGAYCFGVHGDDGRLQAYAYAGYHDGFDSVHGDLRLLPGSDPALAAPLLDTIRQVAADIGDGRPFRLFAYVDDAARRAWFTSLNAEPVRHFWRMAIDFDETPPPLPGLPNGVVIRNVLAGEADLPTVFHIVDTAFQDHFGTEGSSSYDDWLPRHRDFDPALWWLAFVDDQPAAALLGKEWPGTGFVNTLGTLAEFRGRGLGRALLQTSFAEFHARGHRKAALGVDASNPTGAVGLYESVGMRAEHEWVLYTFPPLP